MLAGRMRGSVRAIQSGTVRLISEAARRGALSPEVRRHAAALVAGVDPHDELGQVAAIHAWCRDALRWIADPAETEWVQSAEATLRERFGDCDDLTGCCLALLRSIGFDTAIGAVGPEPRGPFAHVFPLALVDGQWIACEVSEPLALGEELPAARRAVHPVTDDPDTWAGGLWDRAAVGRAPRMRMAGLGHGTSSDCDFPPGRAWEIEYCDPVIPRPQWERYQRTGSFSPGIQKILDATAHCHVNVDVVVGGVTIHGVNIAGVMPPGWYRANCRVAEPPPTPEEVLEQYERPERDIFDVGIRAERLSTPTLIPAELGCRVVPVPTIDLLLPYPVNDGAVRTSRGQELALAGDLGNLVLRIPGSDHPAFSSGVGMVQIAREHLSDWGLELFDWWDRYRAGGAPLDQYHFQRYREVRYLSPIWSSFTQGFASAAATYAPTHMQCLPVNHYPHRADLYGSNAGALVSYQWKRGGAMPNGLSADPDLYGELTFAGNWNYRFPTGLAADGSQWWEHASEGRGGWRQRWVGREVVDADQWTGPGPSAFLEAA